ncbi:MAG: hemerythrin domain-containing protein [Planctomycetes bacterium]|nr:hemerythrin domain-containing protein [Planctomycetota bacterium]
MRSIEIIREEHRVLRGVLDCFESVLDCASRDSGPNMEISGEVLGWFERFADGVHQNKEELGLFPRMIAAAPEISRAVLKELMWLHAEERCRLVALRVGFASARGTEAWERGRFLAAARAYVEFQRHHALLEDEVILPRACEVLDQAVDDEILRTYAQIELDALGPNPEAPHAFLVRLRERAKQIVPSLVPSSHEDLCAGCDGCRVSSPRACSRGF